MHPRDVELLMLHPLPGNCRDIQKVATVLADSPDLPGTGKTYDLPPNALLHLEESLVVAPGHLASECNAWRRLVAERQVEKR
jgi:hypothetical protein